MTKPILPKYDRKYIAERMTDYTNNTSIPILKELCYQENWNYETIQKYAQKNNNIGNALKRMMMKKEAQLEKGALTGQLNATMARFSLSQLGWRGKKDIQIEVKQVEDLKPLAELLAGNDDDDDDRDDD